eukprot:6179710-Pleurochrysis_carterae.AAC.1
METKEWSTVPRTAFYSCPRLSVEVGRARCEAAGRLGTGAGCATGISSAEAVRRCTAVMPCYAAYMLLTAGRELRCGARRPERCSACVTVHYRRYHCRTFQSIAYFDTMVCYPYNGIVGCNAK